MRSRGSELARVEVPNLAPMVDVVMVILIFFMLGTSFAMPEGVIPMQLPSDIGPGGAANVTVVPVVRIALMEDADGDACRIIVMERALPENSFHALRGFMTEKRAAGADPLGPILIAAEPGVAYQQVIHAMDACVRAGFSNIQFSINAGAWVAETGE